MAQPLSTSAASNTLFVQSSGSSSSSKLRWFEEALLDVENPLDRVRLGLRYDGVAVVVVELPYSWGVATESCDFEAKVSEGDGETERWYRSEMGVGPRVTSDSAEADAAGNWADTGGTGSGREPTPAFAVFSCLSGVAGVSTTPMPSPTPSRREELSMGVSSLGGSVKVLDCGAVTADKGVETEESLAEGGACR